MTCDEQVARPDGHDFPCGGLLTDVVVLVSAERMGVIGRVDGAADAPGGAFVVAVPEPR